MDVNIRRSLFQRFLPMSVIVIGLIVLVGLFQTITTRLTLLREARIDNLSWTLSQVEVEVLLLSDAASRVIQTDIGTLKTARRRFDNLYSRVSQLRQSSVFANMREDSTFASHLRKLEFCVKRLAKYIDVSDQALLEKIPKILAELQKVRGIAHDIALTGIRLHADDTDSERANFSNLLLVSAIVTATLIGFLVIISYFMFRQNRKSEQVSIAIEKANVRLKSSFDTSLDAIVVVNTDGKVLEYNGAAETVFGYTASEAVGRKIADFIIPKQYWDTYRSDLERFNKTKSAKLFGLGRIKITALRKNGEEFQIEISVGHAEDKSGLIFVAYIRDITDRIAAEEALHIARDEALEAEKTKSNFLAVMSHEMRTPLNGLFGTIELLEETALSQKQGEYLQLAKESSGILLHHVNDVLDISRLDAGKMDLLVKSINLQKFFENVLTANQTTADAQKNQLILNLHDMPEQNVLIDDHRLRQIAYNLLGNALKFTKKGKVVLSVHTKVHKKRGLELEFSVTDTGIGISKDNIKHIFEEFYTQDESYDRMASGAGLGLAICRRIVDLMGGEISVNSTLGKGSVFTICIPIKLDCKPAVISLQPMIDCNSHNLKSLKILLVEDNDINRSIVREMLKNAGVLITEAVNGAEAVEMAMAQYFDLILMDVSMPVMNGVDATAKIRDSNGPSSDTPILGLTAHALQKEQERFIAAGMNACLCKPISYNVLIHSIKKTLGIDTKVQPELERGDELLLINLETMGTVKDTLGNDKFKHALNVFEREIDNFISSATIMLKKEDFEALTAIAHKSVGSSGILGADALRIFARQLELSAKEKNADKSQQAYEDLSEIWKQTKEQLKEVAG